MYNLSGQNERNNVEISAWLRGGHVDEPEVRTWCFMLYCLQISHALVRGSTVTERAHGPADAKLEKAWENTFFVMLWNYCPLQVAPSNKGFSCTEGCIKPIETLVLILPHVVTLGTVASNAYPVECGITGSTREHVSFLKGFKLTLI